MEGVWWLKAPETQLEQVNLTSEGAATLTGDSGSSVAPPIASSEDGSTIPVGNPNRYARAGDSDLGRSVSVWTNELSGWRESAELWPPETGWSEALMEPPFRFGETLDGSGDGKRIVVGCPGDGYAIVYEKMANWKRLSGGLGSGN